MNEWTPIIDPASRLGVRAWTVLETITAELLESSVQSIEAALFFLYRARAHSDGGWLEPAVQHLNRAIRGAEAMWSTGRLGLFGGLAGLGFVVEHVARELDENLNEDTDAALLLELERGRWRGNPYLATGLTGLGVYFLERLPVPAAARGLELVAGHLEEALRTEHLGHGVYHGPQGTAHFLNRLVRLDIEVERARSLLKRISLSLDAAGSASECAHTSLDTVHAGNRMWRLNQDNAFRAASIQSLERMVTAYERTASIEPEPESFLTGAAGIGLVLLAALTPVEPEWDRIICLSGL